MTALEATREAHRLWCHDGQGVAVFVLHAGEYLVGIAKDWDSLEVYGRSSVSFEDAFQKALTKEEA